MKRPINSLKAALLGIPLVFLTAASAHAVVIDFTSGEGYTNGSLNLQTNNSGTWKTSSSNASFQVNTASGGSVSVDTSVINAVAGYFEPINFSTGGAITTSMDFQFTQGTATVTSATTAFGLAYTTIQGSGTNNTAFAAIGRQNGTDFYRMTAFGNATNITGATLGINSAGSDSLSDVIRMTLTMSYTAGSWSGVATLLNVNTGITVATITRNGFAISSFGPDSLYSAMRVGPEMTTSGLSSLSALNYSTPIPEPGTFVLAGLGLGAVLLFRRRMAQASR